AATTRNRDLAGNSREFPREYVRLKHSQIPGRNDFVIRVRVSQKAALSGRSAWRHIAPNKLSSAKVSIPAEKHQVASDRRLRQAAAAARARLNTPAAMAKVVFRLTPCSQLTR